MKYGRKFAVVMLALIGGIAIAFLRPAEVLAAYATLAGICVSAFMGSHIAQDWGKNGKVTP